MNRKGWNHSEESKNKIGNASRGDKNPFYGKRHSKETREKISKSLKDKMTGKKNGFYGKKHKQETLERIRTPVLNLENGIYYDSVLEANISANIKYSTFRAKLNGSVLNNTSYIHL